MSDTIATTTTACPCCNPTITPSCSPAFLRTLPATIAVTVSGLSENNGLADVTACVAARNENVTLRYYDSYTPTPDASFITEGIPGWYLVIDCTGESCCGSASGPSPDTNYLRMYKITCVPNDSGPPTWHYAERFPIGTNGPANTDVGGIHTGPTPLGAYEETSGPTETTVGINAS